MATERVRFGGYRRVGAGGDWLCGQIEHCLMAVRGKPVVTLGSHTTALRAPSARSLTKPAEIYELVEGLCPGSKVELFKRTPRPGWVGHGDEVGCRRLPEFGES